MRFHAEDAFALRHTDDAIILDRKSVSRILSDHGLDYGDIDADAPALMDAYIANAVDAGDLLAFLGY